MSNPNESDPFNPATWPKTNSNSNPNEPQPINYNQQPPNYNQQNPYNQQIPPNYNQQFPPGGYQQNFPPPGYNPYANQQGMQIDLPSASTAQVCGIIGIVLFWNIIGIILNIVAVVNGGNAQREFERYPGRYTTTSLQRAKTGKTCGTIGLSLVGLVILIVFVVVAANA